MHNVDAVYCYCWSSVVCLCVCLFVGHDCESFKTAEPIKMPFGKERLAWAKQPSIGLGSHWRHLANTVDRSVRRRRYGLSLPCKAINRSTVYYVIFDTSLCVNKILYRYTLKFFLFIGQKIKLPAVVWRLIIVLCKTLHCV